MRRWNGWGDDTIDYRLHESAVRFLEARIGKGRPAADADIRTVAWNLPVHRLPPHPLASIDPADRLTHARGQSLPDWVALREVVRRRVPGMRRPDERARVLDPAPASLPDGARLDVVSQRRLLGRYGAAAESVVASAEPGELAVVPGTGTMWCELRWAARSEGVMHLDDLLLRRTRVGVLLPDGGAAVFPSVRAICQRELGWDDARWGTEADTYQATWQRCYGLPPRNTIPDWRGNVEQAARMRTHLRARRRRQARVVATAGVVACAVVGLGLVLRAHGRRERR